MLFWLNVAVRMLVFLGLMAGMLFGAAGRWDVPQFQAYIAALGVIFIAAMLNVDRDLMKERVSPGPGGQDLTLRRNAILVMVTHLVLAGMDVGRFHWSDTLPRWAHWAGLGAMVGALALSFWAVRTNRFFSPVARIQRDRGHVLVTGGPYRFIRHPGYAASITWFLVSGIALGSWLSIIPSAVGGVLLFLRRLRIEEALLFAELEGYKEYAQRVPWRLCPGIW
jgi:protein-S-isoprenylcysteine O-methyltransferase Ste14